MNHIIILSIKFKYWHLNPGILIFKEMENK